MNIGLYYILQNIRRNLAYDRPVPKELLIKVLVLNMKINEAGGEVNERNKELMKVLSDLLPSSFKEAISS
ncbi:hypothetical protein AVEN_272736-1 [Araneus ventricosus]|uniref:Uncharacterized protein n=2 Tax=Araneus ventricosus TaxID=182803 RepID=A0A4Y2U7G9_ARAVE|nr:hypothetical protein AVEN_272736-1 [Araneus ventricosus]